MNKSVKEYPITPVRLQFHLRLGFGGRPNQRIDVTELEPTRALNVVLKG